jgi:hypothetical protein
MNSHRLVPSELSDPKNNTAAAAPSANVGTMPDAASTDARRMFRPPVRPWSSEAPTRNM